jgi:hypothetical protein
MPAERCDEPSGILYFLFVTNCPVHTINNLFKLNRISFTLCFVFHHEVRIMGPSYVSLMPIS